MPKNNMPRPRRTAAAAIPDHDHRAVRAAVLDRLADIQLQHGYVATAERLAHRASELRGASQ